MRLGYLFFFFNDFINELEVEVQFKIKKTTPLRWDDVFEAPSKCDRKLMDAYCSRLGLQASQVRVSC